MATQKEIYAAAKAIYEQAVVQGWIGPHNPQTLEELQKSSFIQYGRMLEIAQTALEAAEKARVEEHQLTQGKGTDSTQAGSAVDKKA